MNKKVIENSKRIVVKIGSSLLIINNRFNSEWLKSFIDDIIFLRKKNIQILVIVSGSVSLGKSYLKIKKEKLRIHEKQACAACGQVILMNNFKKLFEKKKYQSSTNFINLFGY